jgi:hypothetical protein
MPRFSGRCHCGNLRVAFDSARAAAELPVRTCGCSFCRRHASLAVTDPAGRAELHAADPARVVRYRFGLRTADFLVCGDCGVFVAGVMLDGARAWATLNVNALDDRAAFTSPAEPVSYDAEGPEDRVARRRARWTPAEVRFPLTDAREVDAG